MRYSPRLPRLPLPDPSLPPPAIHNLLHVAAPHRLPYLCNGMRRCCAGVWRQIPCHKRKRHWRGTPGGTAVLLYGAGDGAHGLRRSIARDRGRRNARRASRRACRARRAAQFLPQSPDPQGRCPVRLLPGMVRPCCVRDSATPGTVPSSGYGSAGTAPPLASVSSASLNSSISASPALLTGILSTRAHSFRPRRK